MTRKITYFFQFLLYIASLLAAPQVWAAPGDLDSTFGAGTGWVSSSFANQDVYARSVLQQSDGKLVVAGYGENGADEDFLLMRYNYDGSVDTSFNGSGYVFTDIGGTAVNRLFSAIQQTDGKLVVAGFTSGLGVTVVRYSSDGSLDTDFDSDGIVTTLVAGDDGLARALIQQADGKLVVAGDYDAGTHRNISVIRYNSDGSLDAGFGVGGIRTLDIGATQDYAQSLLQQADGKLVVAGSSVYQSDIDITFVRLNANGSLDSSFGGNGKVTFEEAAEVNSVIQQADGKLVGSLHDGWKTGDPGSSTQYGPGDYIGLVRLNSDGTLDTTFDSDGLLIIDGVGDNDEWAASVVQQSDGKLVVAGTEWDDLTDDNNNFVLVRCNEDGSLDSSFGTGGIVVTNFGEGVAPNDNDSAYSLIQQSDGSLVVAGYSYQTATTSNEFVVARYKSGLGPSVEDDYTNNGLAGWIWRGISNGVEGKHRIWEPDWDASTNNWIIPSRTYPPDWDSLLEYDIETTGDFNGDGDADWLWRAVGNGDDRWKIWQIEDGFRSGQNNPPLFDANHEWSVVGAGDTDKDGDDDVILNNASTGEVMIWEMGSYLVTNTHSVGTKAGYDLVRIGDFDRDGDVDLLLHEQGGTILRFWEIESNAFVQEITTPQTGAGFDTACAGDFDGDGDDDVYLLAATGQSKFFEYENFVRQQQTFGANQSAFTFYGCGDFDGDGTMDTQWTTADGLGYNRILIQDAFGTEKTYYFNRYGGANASNPGYGFEYRGNNN